MAPKRKASSDESYLVIGGEGFLGSTLVKALVERYPVAPVASLDVVQRHFPEKSSWAFHSADLTSLEQLAKAIQASSATTVFHTASPWTGSGADLCEKVNVQGTQTIVDACLQEGVKTLVFTSSAGTVYNGVDLINVDERMPFPEKAIDPYNATKAKAETIVLEANGRNGLLTVALRPSGIFGPGDRQGLPGVIDVLKSGKTNFQIGDNLNLFDWTYVDNVVEAHLIASERIRAKVSPDSLDTRLPAVDKSIARRVLPTSTYRPPSLYDIEKKLDPSFKNTSEPDAPLQAARNRFDQFSHESASFGDEMSVAGQAFFITNGEPTPFWDFPRAVWAEYNGHVPSFTIQLPVAVGMAFAGIGEMICKVTGKTPNLTQSKVVYSTVTRYYNIEKARRVLGYKPVVGLHEGIKRAVAWYKDNEKATAGKA
ncbi:BQ2448_1873 [Microbotryum intermedium]|uniref:BQ2448_1873 protein n=1 Tax=Microbotryum intermedium TaxID=269621 RepID=A0A238FCI0_9BASI|nr:BQ2448_1873 [Microbotryum intermedium]